MDTKEITHVYNLYIQLLPTSVSESSTFSRPRVVNFSSREKMMQHISDLVMRSEVIERRYKMAIKAHFEAGSFEHALTVFRNAQLGNNKPIGFDIYWDEDPQVLL